MGSGLVATDIFFSWLIRSFVKKIPFDLGIISWFGLEGIDGIMFFCSSLK